MSMSREEILSRLLSNDFKRRNPGFTGGASTQAAPRRASRRVPAYDAGPARREAWNISNFRWGTPGRIERAGTTSQELQQAYSQLSDADRARADYMGPTWMLQQAGLRDVPAPGSGFGGASPRDPQPSAPIAPAPIAPTPAPVLPTPPATPWVDAPAVSAPTPVAPSSPVASPGPAPVQPPGVVPPVTPTPTPVPTTPPVTEPGAGAGVGAYPPPWWGEILRPPPLAPPQWPTVGANPYLGSMGGFGVGTPPSAPFSSWGFYPMPFMSQHMPGSFGMATPGMGSWYTGGGMGSGYPGPQTPMQRLRPTMARPTFAPDPVTASLPIAQNTPFGFGTQTGYLPNAAGLQSGFQSPWMRGGGMYVG